MKKIVAIIIIAAGSMEVSAQNVGIGTTAPVARLHVADSSVVFSATGLALPVPGNPPISGTGRRMMWYADKGAFRVGYAAGTSWDETNVGYYSFVAGYGSIASGDHAAAIGLNNKAAGMSTLALGNNAQANTDYSTAIGNVSFANGFASTAIGNTVFATGSYASAFGYNNISKALGGTVVGMFNDFTDNPNPNDTSSLDRIFQIGNGYYDVNIDDEIRRNAVTVLRNGNMGIGTTQPVNPLSVSGNADITGKLGIGVTTPGFPLNFATTLGNKISLYGNSGNHYGFGIQPGLLQVYSDASAANIAFGYGNSGSFTERMRIINSGTDGMVLKGRLTLKNGSLPLDVSQTPGVWLYKADNTGLLGLMGTQNNQNIGFYGGPVNSGWGFVYDAINSRVGIGLSDPQFLMDINGRIRLRHANAEEPGIWLNNNTNTATAAFMGLQNNTNVGFYGATGAGWALTMNTSNGALNINGNAGANKQLLMSNGSSASPAWITAGNIIQTFASGITSLLQLTGTSDYDLPNATLNITVTVPSRILVYSRANTWKVCLVGTCQGKWRLTLFLNGVEKKRYGIDGIRYAAEYDSPGSDVTLGPEFLDVEPGNYTISFKATNSFNDPYITFSSVAMIIPR